MARSLNKVILIGNLGADPEFKTTQGGVKVANLRLATNESWTDKNGQKQSQTDWHAIVLFGAQAEVANKYTKKGSLVLVEGKLRTEKWQDKNGNDRYTTKVYGRSLTMLDPRHKDDLPGDDNANQSGAPAPDLQDDDIPF